MKDHSITADGNTGPLKADDPARTLTVQASAADGRHISVVGDTYTMLVRGEDTEGRYCLIDMLVPDGSGPPPHRHDFEEMFTLLEGELEFTFRGEAMTLAAPACVNVPANAPHQFKNRSGKTVHLLCMCTPAGQDAFFEEVGVPVVQYVAPAPGVSTMQTEEQGKKMNSLAAKYRTEFLS